MSSALSNERAKRFMRKSGKRRANSSSGIQRAQLRCIGTVVGVLLVGAAMRGWDKKCR
jgi:hypothetical protein